jgi:hypothetical protein
MKHTHLRKVTMIALSASLIIAAGILVRAQDPSTRPQAGTPTLTAMLVDAEKKARQKAATVEVKTTGIEIYRSGEGKRTTKGRSGTPALSGGRRTHHCDHRD